MREPEYVLREWAQREPEKPFLLVVCDTFDYEQYPVQCTAEDLASQIEHYDGKNMQRIEGMYIKDGFVPCGRDGQPIGGKNAATS